MSDDDELPPKEAGEYCNARKTDGSGYCKHEAGWGTDHPGVGRCKFHGGSTPDQEKNIIEELEDAAGDATTALRLRIKHVRQNVEDEDADVDWRELNKLAQTILDRAPSAPNKTEDRNVDGDVTHDLSDGWDYVDDAGETDE